MCINPQFKEPTSFLHAVTSTKDEYGNEIIFDTTYNIAIKKETYLNLLKANIISNIPRNKFKEDLILIINLLKNNSIYLDEYLCFPEQVTVAVKKTYKIQIQPINIKSKKVYQQTNILSFLYTKKKRPSKLTV